ncbi:hypothetical protein AJ78_00770 [Emergomyces pasteurianus Ep9510]|uniref:Uncharacterized protein n=1 Tax=Emergomyces pasteurianus Ep9510 TaxID=1447872 RepID=A0A1J9PS24_9EURO|nr:hypothetical protein AJ78_00770 [Emergomyces pasteurianus Ep9510]
MAPKRLSSMDAILTLPPNPPDEGLQRWITAIRAVTVSCSVEEGRSLPYLHHSSHRSRPRIKSQQTS